MLVLVEVVEWDVVSSLTFAGGAAAAWMSGLEMDIAWIEEKEEERLVNIGDAEE